jgi:hypothetical protein
MIYQNLKCDNWAQYIEGVFNKLQDHAYDNDLEDGYKTVIDVPSFVDFMLGMSYALIQMFISPVPFS